VDIENFSAAGKSLGKVTVPRVVKSDEEWRKQLSPNPSRSHAVKAPSGHFRQIQRKPCRRPVSLRLL
jgi:hypothetical protein